MTDFSETLERELVRAARARAARRSPRGSSVVRRGVGLVPAFLSVVVALVIGFGAIVTLHGDHRTGARSTSAGHSMVIRQVVASYRIFRRPQTAADRSVPKREIPERTVMLRHLATKDGHAVFVALTMSHSHLAGVVITEEGNGVHKGAGYGSFTPFPLRKDLPPMVQIGLRWVSFVPDQVTRVVWKSYSGALVTTHPRHNVVYGPIPAYAYGATFYAGSHPLIQETVPVAEFRLTAPGRATATGEASINVTTGEGTQVQISARRVPGRGRSYGLWLYSSPEREHFLGTKVRTGLWPHHSLSGGAMLPANYRSYRQLLITMQASRRPLTPGKTVLEGDVPR